MAGLRFVSGVLVLFISLFASFVRSDCRDELLSDFERIQDRVSKIFSKSGPVTRQFVSKNSSDFETWIIRGVPEQVKRIDAGERIFRHYSPVHDLIRSEKRLQTGTTSYVVIHPGVRREIYEDLTGVFLTDPGVDPRRVGVPGELKNQYVDFRVPSGYPVYELEPGIYLIPTPPVVPGWLKEAFTAYRLKGELPKDPSIRSAVLSLSERGAMTRPARVPIELVDP